MKSIFIVFSPAIEDQVMCQVEGAGVTKYTKFPYLHGVGGHSEPHLDSQVWPGGNMGLFIVTDEKTKDKIMLEVIKLKKEYAEEGIKAFVQNVEEAI